MVEVGRDELPVVVIGAGPVGLAATAHLLERALETIVLEAGDGPGAAVASWGHVRLFSPWRYDVDAAARRLLEATGWVEPDPDALPTGGELVGRYLAPLAATPQIAPRLRTGTRVVSVARDGADKTRSLSRERRGYRVRTVDAGGTVTDVLARAVIDASGTFSTSNPLGPRVFRPWARRSRRRSSPDLSRTCSAPDATGSQAGTPSSSGWATPRRTRS